MSDKFPSMDPHIKKLMQEPDESPLEDELPDEIEQLFHEDISKVDGGYKVYPKKSQKGRKNRRALSKEPMSYKAALTQLRAVERSKNEGIMKITKTQLRKLIREVLTKLPSYDYYEYGIDHVPDKTAAHEDIIGHT